MNEITKYEANNDMMWDPVMFEHAQRIAVMFSKSELIPPHLRNKPADVTIAVLQARRLREDPLILMQNMHVVSGKAGFNASYIIARLNKSGLLKGRVNFRTTGSGKDLAVTAYATDADTGEEVSETITMAMADADGWTKNSKYKSMPERMLKYRAATGLMRLHYPEVMLGTSTVEELEDVAAARLVSTTARPTSLAEVRAQREAELAALPDYTDADEIEEPEEHTDRVTIHTTTTAAPAADEDMP